jgi:hypothetical protein
MPEEGADVGTPDKPRDLAAKHPPIRLVTSVSSP